jgi:ABC-2 type transport system permease protein
MRRDNWRGIYWIAWKDMKTYYLKPPAISWGIIFPGTWILAFYLRNPQSFQELIPGLIAMTILFSTTAAEAVVINFELRLGSLERLLLAPVSLPSVLFGKVVGGAIFGLLMAMVVTAGCVLFLGVRPDFLYLILIGLPSLLAFSSLGALLCVMVREVFEAQALLNIPRFIMIFLCGVVYPVSAMPRGLQYVAHLMPLTYTVDGLQHSFSAGAGAIIFLDALVLLGFFIIFIFPAVHILSRKFQ